MKCIPNHPSILQASENVSTSYPLHLILDDMTGFLNVHLFEMFTSQAQSQLKVIVIVMVFAQVEKNFQIQGRMTVE